MMRPILRSTWTTTSKKLFSKLDFLKAVPVTMIANNKRNEKIPSYLQILYFVFPLPFCPDDALKYWSPPPAQFFVVFITPFKKREGLEVICIHLKFYGIIFVLFCVFSRRKTLMFFECFTAACHVWYQARSWGGATCANAPALRKSCPLYLCSKKK